MSAKMMMSRFAIVFATLASACVHSPALDSAPERDGGVDAPGVGATSCATCSVSCSGLGVGSAGLGTDGQSVFLIGQNSGNEAVFRVAADDSISTLASNRRNMSQLAVGPNALAWWEDDSPDPTATSEVYVLPTHTAGTPLPLAAINPGGVVVDGTNLYYVGTGTTTLSSVPLGGGSATSIASVPAGDLTRLIYVDSDAVYYNDGATNVTSRQPKDGSAATVLAGSAGFEGVSDGVNFYSAVGLELVAIPLDGSASKTLVTWPGNVFYSAPQQFATDGVRVYYIDPVCSSGSNMDCAIRSVPVGGGAVSTLCASLEAPLSIAATATGVYVVDGATLIKLAKE
jgi:hypothetical protein